MAEGNKPGSGGPLDDWESAIDAWESNLELPLSSAPTPAPHRSDFVDEKTPVPGGGAPAVAPALPPAPLPLPVTAEVAPSPDDDPLLHLFDGDMQLPEDAPGEALGTLLGDEPGEPGAPMEPPPPGSTPDELSDLTLDWGDEPRNPEEDFAPVPARQSTTPVVAQHRLAEIDAAAAALDVEPMPVLPPPVPTYDEDAEVEVEVVREETAAAGGAAERVAAVAPPRRQAAPEVLERLRRQLEDFERPTVTRDDDYDYDDISIEASATERASEIAPPPVAAPVDAERTAADRAAKEAPTLMSAEMPPEVAALIAPSPLESDPFALPDDPLDALTALALPAAPAVEPVPDEPEPIALEEDAPAPPPSRLPSSFGPLQLEVSDGTPAPLEPSYLRDLAALLDDERMASSESARAAALAYSAGRALERAGDPAAARDRYDTAREAGHGGVVGQMALRALRRVALNEKRLEDALDLLEREAAGASDRERPGLSALRAEIALAAGDLPTARTLLTERSAVRPGDLRALSGLLDIATAEDSADAPVAAAALADRVADPRVQAALRVEVGRADEETGLDAEAASRYRAALATDPSSRAAAHGLLRVALRGLPVDGEAALDRVAGPWGGALGAAARRYASSLRLARGDATGAAEGLAAAEDWPSLELRARAEVAADRPAAAAATFDRVASQISDAGLRAQLLLSQAEQHERAGDAAAAAAALSRARSSLPDDVALQIAEERVERALGDRDRAIARARAAAADPHAAEADPHAAESGRLQAARLLVEAGRLEEADVELAQLLAAQPLSHAGLEARVDVAVERGLPLDAAQALSTAARAHAEAGDADLAARVGSRAARLFSRAGAVDATLDEARRLEDTELAASARWLRQRLLALLPGRENELAEVLVAEAEATSEPARAAALWHLRGVALEGIDPEAALESQRRALALAPSLPGALLAAALRGGPPELLAASLARVADVQGRPEALALQLRLGALHAEVGDRAAAAQAYAEASALLSDETRGTVAGRVVDELLAGSALRSGDLARAVEIVSRFAAAESDPDARFAREIQLAEWCELGLGRVDAATEHYQKALELRAGSPIALAGITRALESGGRFAVLAERALADLREARDVASRVAAYEQLARVDGEHRGDTQSALMSHESIIQIDHAHHPSFRVLERHYLKEQAWAELIALYDQMGLTATDPALASALILDRARLRERMGGQDNNVENDYRQALFKDGRCRPALRRVLSTARTSRDPLLTAELCVRLAESPETDARAAAVFLTRAGDCFAELGRAEDAIRRYTEALARDAAHLPAMRALQRVGMEQLQYGPALDGSEAAGRVLHDRDERARAWLVAGALAHDRLMDVDRALAAFREVLTIQPENVEAFERVRQLLVERDDPAGLADLLRARVTVEKKAPPRLALLLELAALSRDRLSDREAAKQSLRDALALEPTHTPALAQLSDLHWEDQQFAEAAEVLIRRARLEKQPPSLKEIFFRLGRIYADHLPDAKRAIVSFTRVLQVEPNDRVALAYLSTLYTKESDWKGALAATARLAELESDRAKKVEHLHRVATIQEEGFKDSRAAHHALQRALEVDPRHLPAIGELARFYDRQGDATSSRVHLERSAQGMRTLLGRDPADPAPLHALFKIFGWRKSNDLAVSAAALLAANGAADDEERALLARFAGQGVKAGYPGSALADLQLDDQLFHPKIPPGFRNLFRLLDEPLQKAFRGDLRRLGVAKQDRLRPGHPIRDLASRAANDFGLGGVVDVFVSAAVGARVEIELTEPLSIVIGSSLVEGAHESEVLYHLGGVLRLLRSSMAVPLRMSGDELGILVGGLVRQFVPDFVPDGFEEPAIAAEALRLSKVVPRRLHQELLPFALECADPSVDLRLLAQAVRDTSVRAGLLTSGWAPHALAAVRKRGDAALLRELTRFALSDDFAELRRLVGTALP